ncbi:hypothetical protein GGI11_001809, partial [Coemansia sp. RSA 2049]
NGEGSRGLDHSGFEPSHFAPTGDFVPSDFDLSGFEPTGLASEDGESQSQRRKHRGGRGGRGGHGRRRKHRCRSSSSDGDEEVSASEEEVLPSPPPADATSLEDVDETISAPAVPTEEVLPLPTDAVYSTMPISQIEELFSS